MKAPNLRFKLQQLIALKSSSTYPPPSPPPPPPSPPPTMARFIAAILLIAAIAAFLSTFRAAAVSPAPFWPLAIPANHSFQRVRSRFNQPRQSAESDTSTTASLLKGNATGYWHTAQLSVARDNLAATSLPSQGLALFAGGYGAGFRCEYDEY